MNQENDCVGPMEDEEDVLAADKGIKLSGITKPHENNFKSDVARNSVDQSFSSQYINDPSPPLIPDPFEDVLAADEYMEYVQEGKLAKEDYAKENEDNDVETEDNDKNADENDNDAEKDNDDGAEEENDNGTKEDYDVTEDAKEEEGGDDNNKDAEKEEITKKIQQQMMQSKKRKVKATKKKMTPQLPPPLQQWMQQCKGQWTTQY
eukprot:3567917-Ditylum_brightwellii.AAC.1